MGNSDHCILDINIFTSVKYQCDVLKFNYSKETYAAVREELNLDWDSVFLPHQDFRSNYQMGSKS